MKTKQIIFIAPNVAELLEVECLPPKQNEVTVELTYSAISSGTERANFVGMRNSISVSEDAEAVFPRTVGYSDVGIVTAVGDGVKDISVGERVVVFWGKHRKHITIDRSKVVKVPEGVSDEEAALVFIATFPLGAIRKTHLEIGESALVMGLGILGIFAVEELRAAGAYPVIAADPIKERRELALKLGADIHTSFIQLGLVADELTLRESIRKAVHPKSINRFIHLLKIQDRIMLLLAVKIRNSRQRYLVSAIAAPDWT